MVGMHVRLFAVPDDIETGTIRSQALAECPSSEVVALPGWTVAEVLESGAFGMFQAFAPATPAIEADVCVGTNVELVQFLDLFGVDAEDHLRFNTYQQRTTWGDFVRAVHQGLYAGDPARLAVYRRGVAGGASVEFLDQLLDLLLAGVPGAVAGAIAANVAHPKEFVDQIKASRRRQIAETLRKRGYTGDRLLRVASRYPEWDPEHLQRLFEFTSAEAIRVLVNAGYEAGTDGFWRKSPSADGRSRRDAMDEVERRAWEDADL